MSRYGIHKYSLSLMLTPDIFIKRKYKEQFNLGINLETKSARNLPNEMFKLDEQPSCLWSLQRHNRCGRPQLEKLNFWGWKGLKRIDNWLVAGIPVLLSVISLVLEANEVNLEGIEPKMEKKNIARHSLTIAQTIKLSTSTHTLILFIYPQLTSVFQSMDVGIIVSLKQK